MSELNTFFKQPAGQHELSGALRKLGQQLVTAGRFDEARQSLELSLDMFPGEAENHFDLANVLYSAGRLDAAISEYRQALRCEPQMAPAWYNLGVALMESDNVRDAEHAYRRALRFQPNHPESHNNLAILLQSSKRGREAIQHYRIAAALRPGYYEPRFNLGTLLQDLGSLEEARQVFEELLVDCPGHTDASNNLANVLTELGQHAAARVVFENVLAATPDHKLSRWNLGLNQLRTGDWAAGFENYESRPLHRRSGQPLWDGRRLAGGRVVLTVEQGMGDWLQMARFVPLAAARGVHIAIECHAPLVDLFKRLPGVEQVMAVGEELPAHDYWLPMMSLPGVLGTTVANLRCDVPYLDADPGRVADWSRRLAKWEGVRVGLAWSGNTKFRVNAQRSLGAGEVRQISKSARQASLHLFSLQKGVAAVTGAKLIPLDDDASSMAELAAVMTNLDLIVTVDTSVAHLAGALGRPCWTMLAFHADWRWLTAEHAGSPWYPTMRLFRQARAGDWSNVLDEVGEGLQGFQRY